MSDSSSSSSSSDTESDYPVTPVQEYCSPQLAMLSASITDNWYCTGTHVVSGNDCVIWYGGRNHARRARIDVSNPKHGEIEHFLATGASEMNVEEFTSTFSLAIKRSVIRHVETQLLGPEQCQTSFLDARLRRLNTYGPGQCRDVASAKENVFATLVIVLPTPHKGGSLITSHARKNSIIRTSKLKAKDEQTITYAAFYTDAPYSFTELSSGHLITLTYDLVLSQCPTRPASNINIPSIPSHEAVFSTTFQNILYDSKFLPFGGQLGFVLSHRYDGMLRGSDATIWRVLVRLGFSPSITRHVWDYPALYGGDKKTHQSIEWVNPRDSHSWELGLVVKIGRPGCRNVGDSNYF